jgi:hypothetical protein
LKKATVQTKLLPVINTPPTPWKDVVIRKFFAHLRAVDMDTDATGAEATSNEEAVPGKTDRPHLIILTSATNLIQLEKKMQSVAEEN